MPSIDLIIYLMCYNLFATNNWKTIELKHRIAWFLNLQSVSIGVIKFNDLGCYIDYCRDFHFIQINCNLVGTSSSKTYAIIKLSTAIANQLCRNESKTTVSIIVAPPICTYKWGIWGSPARFLPWFPINIIAVVVLR